MTTFMQDLRYGARMLAKKPALTAVAVISLALGIGANTTIFTLINAVFLNPLPVAEASRVMTVFGTDEKNRGDQFNFMPVSHPNFEDYRKQNDVFSGLVAFMGVGMSLSTGGEPEQVNGLMASGDYFDVLGVKAATGRVFGAEEDRTPGAHPVVVLGHGLWQRRFGGDRSIVGKQITLNNQSFTVIGVAPENFRGTFAIGNTDFWVPTAMHDQVLTGIAREWFTSRRAVLFNVVGRLKPGVTKEQAEAAMKAIGARLEREYPNDNEQRSVMLMPLTEAAINPNFRAVFVRAGGLLMTVVALVLLIACANVANLLLARATARKREMAVRAALGAGRARIVRQLLTESVLLALIGGGAGLFVAYWGRDLLWSFRPPFFDENAIDLSFDPRVLGFTLLVSLLTGLLFGLAPALSVSRPDLVTELKDRGSQPQQGRRFSLRNLLVVAQVALSLVALVGAGLFVKSLRNAQQINPGFETERLAVMTFDVGAQGYSNERGQEFYRQVQERVAGVTGVESAAVATNPPFGGSFLRSVFVEGQEPTPGGRGILTSVNTVGLGYFETMGIPVLKGRDFAATDRENTPRVAVVNEAMARRFWPGVEVVGQRFRFHGDEVATEVVGVVKDSTIFNLGEDPRPQAYLPLLQSYQPQVTLHMRTAGRPESVLGAVRREVQALDRNLPLQNVNTVGEIIAQALWAPRMGAGLLGLFGLLALLLAGVGLYGVISYSVGQRTQEIGVRMALGARGGDILRMVVGQGLVLVVVGVGVGAAAALALTRPVSTLLYSVNAADPLIYAGVAAVLVMTALVACYVPARRAMKVDPLVALRYE
jgi:macrolide transport system ATP-binding/permease protein